MDLSIVFVWTIAILLGFNIFQIWYWSRQVQRLVDKLMSRNYAEYVQATALASNLPQDNIRLPTEEKEAEDQILLELNGMLPRI